MSRSYVVAVLLLAAVAADAQTPAPAPAPAPATAQPPRRPPPTNGGIPVVSPTGRQIVYTSSITGTRQVLVMPADGGEPVVVASGGSGGGRISWSADGSEVLVSNFENDSSRLVAVRPVAGAVPRPVVTVQGRDPVLSPDGRRVLWQSGRMPATKTTSAALDGSDRRDLNDHHAFLTFNATWSPDGRTIAYARLDSARRMEVWLMNADGERKRPLLRLDSLEGSPQWPAWSPDGTRIAVQAGRYDRANPSASTAHIWVVEVATGRATKLAPHDRNYLDETPSWFPDGRIAFQSDRSGRMEVWVMNADGSGARQLTR